MRVAAYEESSKVRLGVRGGGELLATPFASVVELIAAGEDGLRALEAALRHGEPASVARVLAPIPRPGKLLFVGVNYQSHIDENPHSSRPDSPFIFAKLPTAVLAPSDPIVLPGTDHQVDYEGELAVVIGRRARSIRREDAMDHVFGYTIVNDVSERRMQFDHGQLMLGKGYDGFCPMGPELVLADELGDASNLSLTTRLNGAVVQSASTSEMIFDLASVLTFVSAYVTLEPGDIVSTGTPGGVGYFAKPQRFLAAGDRVEVEIEAIGTLANPVTGVTAEDVTLEFEGVQR